jgi:hypothetical protein
MRVRLALWIAFAVPVPAAVAFLFSPSTYAVTGSGATQHVAQQGVFWLPPLLTFAVGGDGLPVLALRSKDADPRRHETWFNLFFVLELIGILGESTVIPSTAPSWTYSLHTCLSLLESSASWRVQ